MTNEISKYFIRLSPIEIMIEGNNYQKALKICFMLLDPLKYFGPTHVKVELMLFVVVVPNQKLPVWANIYMRKVDP